MNEIQLILQPKGSRLCGQTCIAMVTGKTITEIVNCLGHGKGTRTKDLVKLLRSFGYGVPDRLRRLSNPPRYAIAKQPKLRGNNWHWVLIWNGKRYDPAGTTYPRYGSRLTSYLPIEFPKAT